jgi:hypothetical protein
LRNLQAIIKTSCATGPDSSTIHGSRAQDFVDSFNQMRSFIDQSLDEFKQELQRVVFPIFVCLFLNMMLKPEF